jgi:hypothetical protein
MPAAQRPPMASGAPVSLAGGPGGGRAPMMMAAAGPQGGKAMQPNVGIGAPAPLMNAGGPARGPVAGLPSANMGPNPAGRMGPTGLVGAPQSGMPRALPGPQQGMGPGAYQGYQQTGTNKSPTLV